MDKERSWNLIIKPKAKFFNLNIKEIWDYRDLIVLFVRRDIVTKYKQTILGPLWFIIQPIFTTVMYLLVFGKFASIPTDNAPPVLFYLTGIVAWTYFSVCLNNTAITFVTNANLFGKVYFPRLTVPISIVISNLIQFLIQFLLLILIMTIYWFKGYSFNLGYNMILLPVLILLLAVLGLGFGIIVSSLTTKYRDLANLMGFGVQLWMYATPIIYPLSVIPDKFKLIILSNPITSIVITFRSILLGTEMAPNSHLIYSSVFAITILLIGILIYQRVERSFMDII